MLKIEISGSGCGTFFRTFLLVFAARIICAMFILIFLSLAAGDDG
jgi:hypothetical protein